jgi:hypothetical protein
VSESLAGSPYRPVGGALELLCARESEVLLAGPSGTGKSRACLEKLHYLALQYGGLRGLILRKTRESLTHSGLATYERCVLARTPAAARRYARGDEYRYTNGSRLVVGGMDKVAKIMSSEYDCIYVQEATELSEDEWEHLTTRLRGSSAPFCQIMACCNPAGPNHWLKQRAEAGRLRLIASHHEDNPLLYDAAAGSYTPFGATYLAKLDALSGVRYQRLRLGLWVSAEGIVYEEFDWNVHVRSRESVFAERGLPPASWRRLWVVDFGYTQPFVWQAWCQDPESGTLYRYAELYYTQLLVEQAATHILAWMQDSGEPFPEALICDHDAEGRATLRARLGIPTVPAVKSVPDGIQAVKVRLLSQTREGRNGIVYVHDSLVRRDSALIEAKEPTCTEEEVELYLWREGVKDSEPMKGHDHGLDATRYLVAYVDGHKRQWTIEEIIAYGEDKIVAPDGRRLTVEEWLAEQGFYEDQDETRPGDDKPGDRHGGDWRKQWLREVDAIQAERKRRLIRGGR